MELDNLKKFEEPIVEIFVSVLMESNISRHVLKAQTGRRLSESIVDDVRASLAVSNVTARKIMISVKANANL